MNELSKLLQENLNIEFISATLSNPKNKDSVQKVKVRPILKKDILYFQLESFRNNQAFHENVEEKKACEILLKYMENMRQMQMETQRAAYTILVSKKGKVTIKSKMKKGEKKQINMSHDRKKKYVLEEGVPVPFLQDLGVMTQDGNSTNSGRSTGSWNLSRIYCRSLIREENLQSWILAVVNLISHLPCIIICMN